METPRRGSACGPVIVPVFKTGGRQVTLSPVGSTPTRFRHACGSFAALRISAAGSHLRCTRFTPAKRRNFKTGDRYLAMM